MIVDTVERMEELLKILRDAPMLCTDLENLDRNFPNTTITGIGIGWSIHDGAYIPVGHAEGEQLPLDYVTDCLKPIFEMDKLHIFHNGKYDMKVMTHRKVVDWMAWYRKSILEDRVPRMFDTMIASWMIDTEGEHGLKALAKRYLDIHMVELDDFCPAEKDPITGDKVYRCDLTSIEDMGRYNIADVTVPIRLMYLFVPMLDKMGLAKVFSELEMPTVFSLMEMELNGITINQPVLAQHMVDAPAKMAEAEQKVYDLRPNKEPFNIGSGAQLNKVLFEELGLKPHGKRGKSGLFSVDQEALSTLDHPIVAQILEYKGLQKLMSTYITGMTKRICKEDGKLRTTFNQMLSTGRLSSKKPNLQNIPRPDNDVFKLRELFTCSPGKKLIVTDYSQIELRVLAHISKDPGLIEAFKNGWDMHSTTAKKMFNLEEPVEEVKKKHPELRSVGKTINFAAVFESSGMTIGKQAGVSEQKGEEFKALFFKAYPGVAKYIEDAHKFSEKHGYVLTLTGRYRHLPDSMINAKSKMDNIKKSSSFRKASNCVDAETEILTADGWKNYKEIGVGTQILTKDIETGVLEFNPINQMCIFDDGLPRDLIEFNGRSFSALTTLDHRWIVYNKSTGRDEFKTSENLSVWGDHRIHRTGTYAKNALFHDDLVHLIGWFLTDGSLRLNTGGKTYRVVICQSPSANAWKCELIDSVISNLDALGHRYESPNGLIYWRLKFDMANVLGKMFPDRTLTPDFINALSQRQARMLVDTMLLGDGSVDNKGKRTMTCGTKLKADMFQMLCVIAGYATNMTYRDMSMYAPVSTKMENVPKMTGVYIVTILRRDKVQISSDMISYHRDDSQVVWCPQVKNQSFIARRKGTVYVTGNTPVQGSAADLMMLATRNMYRAFVKAGIWEDVRILLMVHDEILVEASPENVELASKIIKDSMETAMSLVVPLIAEPNTGITWMEAK